MTEAQLRERFLNFGKALRDPDATPSLLDAAELVARCERPRFDPEYLRAAFADLEAGARPVLMRASGAQARAAALCSWLHDVRGFRGDAQRYHERASSCIDEVLRTGQGIPVTLAVVYVELGERLGLQMEGVNFPGHFLVRVRSDGGEAPDAPGETDDAEPLLIDPWAGRVIGRAECEQILRRAQGPGATLQPGHLQPATPLQVLVRMLNNLKQLALAEQRFEDALRCSERILLAEPGLVFEHRDRAVLHERLGQLDLAVAELELLAAAVTDPQLEARIRARIRALQARGGAAPIVH